MEEKDCLFIADAHIYSIADKNQKFLLNFFDQIKKGISVLYILGDLFDFWVGYSSVVYFHYLPLLNKLMELKKDGIIINYIEGNHDFNIGSFFKYQLRAQTFRKEAIITLHGKKIYLSHGNGLNKKDYGYLVLHNILRSPFITCLIKILPPDLVWKIARLMSKSSRGHSGSKKDLLRQSYIDFSYKKFKHGFDTVILAHIHNPEIFTTDIAGQKKNLITLGDWVSQYSYLLYNQSEGFRLLTFSP